MIFSINRQHFQIKFDHLLPNEFDHLVHAHGIFCHLKHNTFFQKWLFHAFFFVVLWKVELKNWYVSFRALFIFLGCFYKYLQNYNFWTTLKYCIVLLQQGILILGAQAPLFFYTVLVENCRKGTLIRGEIASYTF